MPIKGLIEYLLKHEIPAGDLPGILDAGLRACVVTSAEDKALTAAGVASSSPDGDDPWKRYRLAGIDVDKIRPLRRHVDDLGSSPG